MQHFKEYNTDNFIEMSEKEKIYAKSLSDLSNKIKHPALRAVFLAISSDSIKHSLLYQTLVQFLTSAQPVITQEEFDLVAKEIDNHIETEAQMIKFVEEIISKVNDARIKFILSAILSDEIVHHKLLVSIKDNLVKRELITEEDVWEAIWRESPWRGTPGG